MISYFELCTILVDVECVVNSKPLTYIFDDIEGVSYTLTPILIHGRNLLQAPSSKYAEVVSTHESLSRRGKYQNRLLFEFTKWWGNEYLLDLKVE